MAEKLTITIDEDSASSLVTVLGCTLRLLSAVERDASPQGTPCSDWIVESASKNSPIQLVLHGSLRQGKVPIHSVPLVVDGLSKIEKRAVRPRHFSNEAMNAARSLVSRNTPFEYRYNGTSVRPTSKVLSHVDTLMHYTSAYNADMAIDGRLDALYMHGDNPQFFVFDPLTDAGIRCYFSESDVDSVISLLRNRVRVYGDARFDKRDEVVSINVEWFERLPEEDEVPTLQDMHDAQLNITDGMDAADYIRRMRDGQ